METLVPGKPPVFFDRAEQVETFLDHLDRLRSKPGELAVLEVLGFGGMGKSSFLEHARTLASEREVSAYRINLHGEEVSGETTPLHLIRDAFGVECPLFDTALLAYWGQVAPHFDRVRSSSLAGTLPIQALEQAGRIAGFPLPLTFALDVLAFGKESKTMLGDYRYDEFAAIDELSDNPEDLRELLPMYLATDLLRGLDSDVEIVLLYDGYDRQGEGTIDDGSPWLRTFIKTLSRGMHVIGTRERLNWPEGPWGVPEVVGVDELPDVASRELVESRLGPVDPRIEKRIFEVSQRIPFHLESMIRTYERARTRGNVDPTDLPTSLDDSVASLLGHFGPNRRLLAVALATIQFFDKGTFDRLAHELRIPLVPFTEVIGRHFVEPVSPSIYKTHDILTDFVRESIPEQQERELALTAATEGLLDRCSAGELESAADLLTIFGAVVTAWYSIDSPPARSVETLVDACYLLYDAGYWQEVGSMPLAPDGRRDHPVSIAMELFAAISSRRSMGVAHALELFAALDGRTPALGRHEQSAELELAYVRELAGDYAQARRDFVDFEGRIKRFDPTNRIHVRSRLYLADMQTMDGNLLEASRLFLDTSEKLDPGAIVDWAELVRHRGHALRFSFLFEDAAERYVEALTEVGSAPALCGKLHTNLAETYCWSNPALALKQADLSMELNRKYANRIELAKCDAARGIALARLERFDDADEAIQGAFRWSQKVQYPASSAFALQAEAIARGLARDDEGLKSALKRLEDAIGGLGTYGHLMVAPLFLAGDWTAFEQAARLVEWIEPDGLRQRLASCLIP